MANASVVPLGSGVSIASGLNKSLGYLLDCNQATYNIASGTAWHLLYIKAERNITESTFEPGWTFALESKTIAQVNSMFTPVGDKSPRIVDKQGHQMRNAIAEATPHQMPYAEAEVKPGASLTSVAQVTGYPVPDGQNVRLDYLDNQHWLTLASEVGVHIYPIAYHRISTGSPPTAEIVQCARSDFHFWPLPTIPLWWQMDNLSAIEVGVFTEIPE